MPIEKYLPIKEITFKILLENKCLPGQGTQSGVFWTFGPPHGAPPFNGVGLLQLLVRFWPTGDRPGHLHSVHWLHELQPPSTINKNNHKFIKRHNS